MSDEERMIERRKGILTAARLINAAVARIDRQTSRRAADELRHVVRELMREAYGDSGEATEHP